MGGRLSIQMVTLLSLILLTRFVCVNWDLDEVAELKDRILTSDSLIPTISKLSAV